MFDRRAKESTITSASAPAGDDNINISTSPRTTSKLEAQRCLWEVVEVVVVRWLRRRPCWGGGLGGCGLIAVWCWCWCCWWRWWWRPGVAAAMQSGRPLFCSMRGPAAGNRGDSSHSISPEPPQASKAASMGKKLGSQRFRCSILPSFPLLVTHSLQFIQ